MIGGKAAPGYWMPKLIIKLICAVGKVVNNNPGMFKDLHNSIMNHDRTLTLADYASYIAPQEQVNKLYMN